MGWIFKDCSGGSYSFLKTTEFSEGSDFQTSQRIQLFFCLRAGVFEDKKDKKDNQFMPSGVERIFKDCSGGSYNFFKTTEFSEGSDFQTSQRIQLFFCLRAGFLEDKKDKKDNQFMPSGVERILKTTEFSEDSDFQTSQMIQLFF